MRWVLLGLACGLFLGGCGPKADGGPAIESPAGEPRYAVAYPDLVEQDMAALAAIDAQVEAATAKFAEYPDELDGPKWERVQEIVELADAAGRSRVYVERHDETAAVMRFFVDEDQKLKQRVGGAVVYTGKQQGCSDPGMLGGTANLVLQKTVDERLEERLHEGSVAHGAIDRYESELGEKNVEMLREQVDTITAASFAVYVDAVRLKLALRRRIEEVKDVEETLELAAEEYSGLAQDGEKSAAEREEAREHSKAARAAKSRLSRVVEKAEERLEDLGEHIDALQGKYEERLKALIEKIEAHS